MQEWVALKRPSRPQMLRKIAQYDQCHHGGRVFPGRRYMRSGSFRKSDLPHQDDNLTDGRLPAFFRPAAKKNQARDLLLAEVGIRSGGGGVLVDRVRDLVREHSELPRGVAFAQRPNRHRSTPLERRTAM